MKVRLNGGLLVRGKIGEIGLILCGHRGDQVGKDLIGSHIGVLAQRQNAAGNDLDHGRFLQRADSRAHFRRVQTPGLQDVLDRGLLPLAKGGDDPHLRRALFPVGSAGLGKGDKGRDPFARNAQQAF